MLLTRIHATTALLFEDVIIKIPWRSPCFTSYWVVAVARKTFQPGWWVDTQRKTENIHQTFIAKRAACVVVVGGGASTVHFRPKLGRHRQCLSKRRRNHVLGRDTGGTQVSQRQQKPTAFVWSSGVFQHWRVWACLLYRRLFVYLTLPSAHLWECCYPAWGLAVPSIFNDVHTNPSELFKCHFIHLPPNSSFIHRLP